MRTDRRKLLAWSAGGAAMLGLAGLAGAQTAPAPVSPGAGSRDRKADQNSHMEKVTSPMKHAFAANLIMIAELTVKPEKLDAFLDYTVSNLALSRSSPGNVRFDILIDEAEPNKVIFYEVWKSPKAQQDYMAWRIQAGDLTKLLSFLAGEPKFTALRSIAA